MARYLLLIKSAQQIVQVVNDGRKVLCGEEMKYVAILEANDESNGYSIVVDRNGLIHDIDTDENIQLDYSTDSFDTIIDASGKSVIPGLIDGHTHPVWNGDRVHEFEMKLAGASYMEVHKAGGGINFTVNKTRQATEEQLYESFQQRLDAMIKSGTTLVECKSGYGLDTDNEVKMLRVIERGKRKGGIDISSTYCGAHAVPKGKTADEATHDVINNQIPTIKRLMNEREITVNNIDVFCEKGVFNLKQSRDILLAGKSADMNINFHGDELSSLHSAEMGAEIGAVAISHLEEITDEGIKAMARTKTIAVILPTTAYILRLSPPPVRQMIDEGVPVALASDFNPNAYCSSMPLVMHLACVLFKMSLAEALTASTINAAASLNMADKHGSIEKGKLANLLILNTPKWQHLVYKLGCHDQVLDYVIWHGMIAHQRK